MRVYLENCCYNRPYDDQTQLKISLESQAKLHVQEMDKGMGCLLQNLGIIETEKFIAMLLREQFDYTEWRRGYFGDASVSELTEAAAAYAKEHPFQPKREVQRIG